MSGEPLHREDLPLSGIKLFALVCVILATILDTRLQIVMHMVEMEAIIEIILGMNILENLKKYITAIIIGFNP